MNSLILNQSNPGPMADLLQLMSIFSDHCDLDDVIVHCTVKPSLLRSSRKIENNRTSSCQTWLSLVLLFSNFTEEWKRRTFYVGICQTLHSWLRWLWALWQYWLHEFTILQHNICTTENWYTKSSVLTVLLFVTLLQLIFVHWIFWLHLDWTTVLYCRLSILY